MAKSYYVFPLLTSLLFSSYGLARSDSGASSEIINLEQINRPVLESNQLNINTPRKPHFLFKDRDGTEIIEYREKNRPNNIEVHSGFGTSYQLTQPENGGLQMHNNNLLRLPTVNLFEF
jgi:hypothetical protein